MDVFVNCPFLKKIETIRP